MLREIAGRFKDAVFLQMGLDILFHERSRTLTSALSLLNAKLEAVILALYLDVRLSNTPLLIRNTRQKSAD